MVVILCAQIHVHQISYVTIHALIARLLVITSCSLHCITIMVPRAHQRPPPLPCVRLGAWAGNKLEPDDGTAAYACAPLCVHRRTMAHRASNTQRPKQVRCVRERVGYFSTLPMCGITHTPHDRHILSIRAARVLQYYRCPLSVTPH